MLRHYSLKQKITTILKLLIYAAFVFFVIQTAVEDHSLSGIVFVIIGIVALIFGLLNEYLKYLYNEALWYLNFKIDVDKACQLYDKLVKHDLFHIYEKDRAMFDVLVALERKQSQKIVQIIKNNEKKFSANVELYLIKTYMLMRAYLLQNNRKMVNELYADVINIKNMKKGKPKVFQFDELEGIKYSAAKEYKQAYEHYKNINMKLMNYRERKFILEQLILTAPNTEKEIYKEKYNVLMGLINESK